MNIDAPTPMTQQNTLPLSKWKPYPAYENSGVEWLGEIPGHWEVRRLKFLLKVVNGSTPKSSIEEYWDGEIPWVTPDDLGKLQARIIFQTDRNITKEGYESCGTTIAPAGSLVLSTRAPIGHLAIAGTQMCTNQGCKMLVFRKPDIPEYFFYQISAARSELESWGQGATFKELSKHQLECVRLINPPLQERRAIVDFLSQETAKIDSLVGKKERQIELLQEKRTAIISRAVTRGLDPNVPLKDSGIDWLGHIPAHWEVFSLKRIARIRYGLGQPPEESYQGLPLLRATNVTYGKITENGLMYVDPEDVPISRGAKLTVGEILVVRSGAYTGDSAIVPEEYAGAIAGYDMVVSVFKGYSSYIAWQILSSEIRDLQFGFYKLRAAQPHLNAEELKLTVIVFPPLSEQIAISAFLDKETSEIDTLITKIQEGIDRLKEYRTALISAAVTGKIDVRGAASRQGAKNPEP